MVRGETIEIEVTVTDDATPAVPIDLDGVTGLLIALYQKSGPIVAQWSKVAKTGFGVIDITDAPAGICSVYLEASDSLKANPKDLFLEVKVAQTNGNFTSSTQISIDTAIELETIEPSVLEGVSPV